MTTKWSFEVPIPHLLDFHEDQDFIFSLSFLFDPNRNPMWREYIDYMKEVKHEGLKTIWIDNSYNETLQADSIQQLIRLKNDILPSKIVIPDHPNMSTVEVMKNIDIMLEAGCRQEELICVVTTHDMYHTVSTHQDPMIFAVPYDLKDKWMFDDLLQIRNTSNLHYLGFNDPSEITAVWPQSCDTGMPIKLAIQHKTFEEWCIEGCPHIHNKDLGKNGMDFFTYTLTRVEMDLAKYNIKRLKEVCQ